MKCVVTVHRNVWVVVDARQVSPSRTSATVPPHGYTFDKSMSRLTSPRALTPPPCPFHGRASTFSWRGTCIGFVTRPHTPRWPGPVAANTCVRWPFLSHTTFVQAIRCLPRLARILLGFALSAHTGAKSNVAATSGRPAESSPLAAGTEAAAAGGATVGSAVAGVLPTEDKAEATVPEQYRVIAEENVMAEDVVEKSLTDVPEMGSQTSMDVERHSVKEVQEETNFTATGGSVVGNSSVDGCAADSNSDAPGGQRAKESATREQPNVQNDETATALNSIAKPSNLAAVGTADDSSPGSERANVGGGGLGEAGHKARKSILNALMPAAACLVHDPAVEVRRTAAVSLGEMLRLMVGFEDYVSAFGSSRFGDDSGVIPVSGGGLGRIVRDRCDSGSMATCCCVTGDGDDGEQAPDAAATFGAHREQDEIGRGKVQGEVRGNSRRRVCHGKVLQAAMAAAAAAAEAAAEAAMAAELMDLAGFESLEFELEAGDGSGDSFDGVEADRQLSFPNRGDDDDDAGDEGYDQNGESFELSESQVVFVDDEDRENVAGEDDDDAENLTSELVEIGAAEANGDGTMLGMTEGDSAYARGNGSAGEAADSAAGSSRPLSASAAPYQPQGQYGSGDHSQQEQLSEVCSSSTTYRGDGTASWESLGVASNHGHVQRADADDRALDQGSQRQSPQHPDLQQVESSTFTSATLAPGSTSDACTRGDATNACAAQNSDASPLTANARRNDSVSPTAGMTTSASVVSNAAECGGGEGFSDTTGDYGGYETGLRGVDAVGDAESSVGAVAGELQQSAEYHHYDNGNGDSLDPLQTHSSSSDPLIVLVTRLLLDTDAHVACTMLQALRPAWVPELGPGPSPRPYPADDDAHSASAPQAAAPEMSGGRDEASQSTISGMYRCLLFLL